MRAIFVNYGNFNSNSGGHIAHFANAVAHQGAEVLVVGNGDETSLSDYGDRHFRAIRFPSEADVIPDDIMEFASAPDAIIHAWTPRGNVVQLVDRLVEKTGSKYIVHLEDNEELLLAANLGIKLSALNAMSDEELEKCVPTHLSHPRKAGEFMQRSNGVTMIVATLDKFRPETVPGHVLEPGVDHERFAPDLSDEKRAALREELYIDKDATVVVYHGNLHAANLSEVFSLYTAVLILRRRGHNVVLIRAGCDYVESIDPSFNYLKGDWVINLGFLDRARLIEVLKLADVFVQPGAPGDFNDYRLPSKLPEFLSLGRPVLLPKTNIGLRMSDNENAILLSRGDGEDIADRIERLIRDVARMEHIGHAARQFAIDEFDWNKSGKSLLEFYQRVLVGA